MVIRDQNHLNQDTYTVTIFIRITAVRIPDIQKLIK